MAADAALHLTPARINDVHSKLNRTSVTHYRVASRADHVRDAIRLAERHDLGMATCGGRHAMGGQQFARDGLVLDMSGMDRVLSFDGASGLIEVQAGIRWPRLFREYRRLQGKDFRWGIRQKQTGADELSIGGAVAANIHGRVLDNPPLIEDIVSFRLIDADGRLRTCSRSENVDLFRLVVGGYGLFGVVVSVTLQLAPRQKLERVVEVRHSGDLAELFADRIGSGYVYGDFQFATDERSEDFLRRGILSCYRPTAASTPIPDGQRYMTERGWQDLLYLAHADKSRAFDEFSQFYLATSGQIYWSDEHQFTVYLDDYHGALDRRLGGSHRGSEMITELYVPVNRVRDFLEECRRVLRRHDANLIYGTVRLIREDKESFLAWARRDFACVVFNLHVDHTGEDIAKTRRCFRALIDVALRYEGSYFLTYHGYASRRQLLAAYPQFPRFLAQKRALDPRGRFSSDWYRRQCALLGLPYRCAA